MRRLVWSLLVILVGTGIGMAVPMGPASADTQAGRTPGALLFNFH